MNGVIEEIAPELVTPTCDVVTKDVTKDVTKNEVEYTDYSKINFSSVLVNGLRVLFAKAVAFNVLLTVKVLMF